MLESKVKTVTQDLNTLVKDAQALFQSATALSGEKADEVRDRGMHLLEAAITKAQEMQASAVTTGKQIAASTDTYVKENPWRMIAAAAGVGVLVGVILARK